MTLFIAALLIVVLIIAALKNKVKTAPGLFLEFIINQTKIGGTITMVQLKDTQQVSGQITPKDSKGAAAPVQAGSCNYSSSDENVCTVEKDADDETKFKIKAGVPGVAQVNISADADLGEGVATIEASVAVEVTGGQATALGVSLGEPEEQGS